MTKRDVVVLSAVRSAIGTFAGVLSDAAGQLRRVNDSCG
jgi:hypothetical protein